jgi:ribokinase
MNLKKVTVIGSLNFDIIFKQSRLPEIGETFSADSITFSGGGKGANQAVQCAKLGLDTHLVGRVGNDNFGEKLVADLKNYGINTDFIEKSKSSTGIGVVNAIDDGRLSSTIYKGANHDLTIRDVEKAKSIIEKSDVVILQLEVPRDVVEYAIGFAKDHGCYVILNAAPASDISEDKLKLVDCLVVNEIEAGYYTGRKVVTREDAEQACEDLYPKINGLLIVTLGEKGSIIYDGNTKHFFEAEKVKAVETTGAGDSYIGAITYSLAKDFSYEEMGQFAAKVSAKTVMKVGSQEAMPVLADVF